MLKQPGVRLLIGDGRSHLRLSTRQYDVIVSEPSNPWMAGVAALFTREFFEAARARLRPGGVFCQWAHTYEIAEQDLRSIVRTFASVFPDGTMWLVGEGDLLLIGSASRTHRVAPARASPSDRGRDRCRHCWPTSGVPPSAAPFVLLSLFAGGARELAAFGDGARLQTDDRMSLEFTAARAMYEPPEGNAARLRALAPRSAVRRWCRRACRARMQQTGRRAATQHCRPGRSGWRTRVSAEPWRSTAAQRDALRGSTDAAAQARTLPPKKPNG